MTRILPVVALLPLIVACASHGCPPGSVMTPEGRCIDNLDAGQDDGGSPADSGQDAAEDACPGCVDVGPPDLQVRTVGSLRVPRGGSARFDVEITRNALEAFEFQVIPMPEGVTAEFTLLGDMAEVTLTASEAAAVGRSSCIVHASAPEHDAVANVALYVADAPGTPDTSFDIDGTTTFSVTDLIDSPHSLAFVHDSRLLIAGEGQGGDAGNIGWLVRLGRDGSLDDLFGDDGRVVDVGMAGSDRTGATAVRALSDGRYLLAGFSRVGGAFQDHLSVRLTRGGLDESFADEGFLHEDDIGTVVVADEAVLFASGFADVRRLDVERGEATSFATVPEGLTIRRMVIDGDGRTVVGSVNTSTPEYVLARFDRSGSLDGSFGDAGVVRVIGEGTDFFDVIHIHPVGDHYLVLAQAQDAGFREQIPVLIRLHEDGALDTSFGGSGVVRVLERREDRARVTRMVGLPDGGSLIQMGSETFFYTRRFQPDGSWDREFGEDGSLIQTGNMILDPDPVAQRVLFVESSREGVSVHRYWL